MVGLKGRGYLACRLVQHRRQATVPKTVPATRQLGWLPRARSCGGVVVRWEASPTTALSGASDQRAPSDGRAMFKL